MMLMVVQIFRNQSVSAIYRRCFQDDCTAWCILQELRRAGWSIVRAQIDPLYALIHRGRLVHPVRTAQSAG